jgi:hypothetical protein
MLSSILLQVRANNSCPLHIVTLRMLPRHRLGLLGFADTAQPAA